MALDRRSKLGINIYFFCYHAALGLVSPFVPLFLQEHLKFSYTAWGGLALTAAVSGAAVQIGIGYLSDHLRMRRPLIAAATITLAISYQIFWHLHSYKAFVALFALNGIMQWSALTLVTALVGDLSGGENRSFIFASLRVYGSIGWVLALVCTLIWRGLVMNTPLFFGLISGFYLFSGLAMLPVREKLAQHVVKPSFAAAARMLAGSRNMMLFCFAYMIFMLSLNSINNFLSLFIKQEIGLSAIAAKPYISAALITSATCEMPFMLLLSRLSDRIGRKPLLLVSFASLPIRLFLLSRMMSPDAVVMTQALHGLTWGVMMVISVAFIAESVPAHLRASGQGLLTMMTAASSGLWAVAAGRIADTYSLSKMFLVVSLIALCALVLGFFLREPSIAGATEEKEVLSAES